MQGWDRGNRLRHSPCDKGYAQMTGYLCQYKSTSKSRFLIISISLLAAQTSKGGLIGKVYAVLIGPVAMASSKADQKGCSSVRPLTQSPSTGLL